ncbi:putative cytochrome-like protein P450 [Ampelomyces quisqualis]|uniref:Putative cytochrome-like protein P450 n=1 Tax=Ampelomyces quisqualis TaxID=50730 RepID=A0A6A5QSK9_AMPQU|nr:putative cytochrome-like protein P450 [Ampelomyces quisqualis]
MMSLQKTFIFWAFYPELAIILTLIIVPVATYYGSRSSFQRRTRGKRVGKVPPTIPYYVPGIFHAFSLASIGPQKYFAQLLKKYDSRDPFCVRAGPQPLVVVRDLKHVKTVLSALQAVTPAASRLEHFDKIYGSPRAALDLYANEGINMAEGSTLQHAHVTVTQKHLTGMSLSANIETYMTILSCSLNDKMFQVGSWTQIEDSWSFLRQVITRCHLTWLFGKDIFKQYPNIFKDYWEFVDAFEGFFPGLPRYWVPGAASQVRERLLQGIGRWLKVNHSGSDFARIIESDPVWDELKGLKFLQERDEALAQIKCMDVRARAAEMLSIIHETTSALVPCVTWSLLELARRPEFAKRLTISVSRYSPSSGATYNINDITNMPFMESLLAETVRLRTAPIEVYITHKGLVLDDNWRVLKEVPIVTLLHDLALHSQESTNLQSKTVGKPLEEFWPERFSQKSKSNKLESNSEGGLRDVAGLDRQDSNFDRGQPPLLGREYLPAAHAATMAIFLNEFELQLCDPELFDAALPPPRELAFGILKPVDKVEVRIRKRNTSSTK